MPKVLCEASQRQEGDPPGPDGIGHHTPEDAEQFVDLTIAREERTLGDQLGKNTTHGPHVHWGRVASLPKQDLRSTIPEGDHLVRVCADGHAKCSSETKVGQFQYTLAVDEQVGQLQVAMENTVRMTIGDAFEELEHVALWQGHLG